MTVKQLVVISGGLSEESTTHRLADALGKATARLAAEHDRDVRITRVNIRDFAHEIASASLTGYASEGLAQAYEELATADGVIAVSPTYKASYTGLFKAFWDVTPDGMLTGLPVLLGATGGTPRHSLVTDYAMRPLFAYLKALTLPTAVFAATDDWGSAGLRNRIEAAASELATHLSLYSGGPWPDETAMPSDHADLGGGTVRPRTQPEPEQVRARAADPFVAVPTMEQMLG